MYVYLFLYFLSSLLYVKGVCTTVFIFINKWIDQNNNFKYTSANSLKVSYNILITEILRNSSCCSDTHRIRYYLHTQPISNNTTKKYNLSYLIIEHIHVQSRRTRMYM